MLLVFNNEGSVHEFVISVVEGDPLVLNLAFDGNCQSAADLVERPGIGEVLEPRDGRLARNVVTALGRTLAGDQQRGILAQRVEVIGILVAGGDRHHARRHHGTIGVDDEQRIARIRQRVRDHGGEAEAARRLTQHDQTAVGRKIAGIPRGCERLRSDR